MPEVHNASRASSDFVADFFNQLTVKVFHSIVLFFEIFILLEPAVVKTFFFSTVSPSKKLVVQ